IKAGAADESTIHVGLHHDPGDVIRLDRAPVQDPHLVGDVTGEPPAEPGSDGSTTLLGVFWHGYLARPDRPDRFVGDHDAAGLRRLDTGESPIELTKRVLDLTALAAYIEALPDAHDRGELVGLGRLDLGVHEGIVLMVVLPPLRVTDDDIAAAELGEHGGGHLAGVGAVLVLRHVLRAVLDQ